MIPAEVQAQALQLAKQVELLALVPTGMLARLTAGETPPPPGEEVDVHLGIRVGMAREKDRFVGVVAVTALAQRKQARRAFAKFSYRVNAHYRGGADATDEVLGAFVQTNGLIHVWPYARAFVQTASATMGLVPLLLPFYRVQAPNAVQLQPQARKR